MNHQKKLRNIILQLSEPQKIRLLQLYAQNHTALNTHVKKISFNCHESTLQINNHIYNGYGKTHSEALNAGINMLLEAQLKNQVNHQALKEALKKLSINPAQECTHDKIKTQPDVLLEKSRVQLVGRTSFGQTRMKQPVSKGAKSIKQQIFQSLNRSCFKKGEQGGKGKVINQSLTKEPSCVLLSQCQPKNHKRQQIQSILNRVRQLQQKLEEALHENEYLKAKVSQKQQLRRQVRGANASSYMRRQASDYMIKRQANDRQAEMSNKNQMNLLYRQSKQAMADITNKMSSLLQNKENYKLRSFSVSNSAHHSNFNSKAMQSKIKIPKLNLQILPNYHGKSNKSLNQSLLDNYEKKVKANGYM